MAKVYEPATVGVPERTPADESVKPVGNEPLATLYVGVGVPLATKVNNVNAVPVIPLVAGVWALNDVGACVTVIVIGELLILPTLLLACTVKVYEPAAVGVPESTPAEESARPVGNVPLATLYVGMGLPLATKV